jgi:hypothetical protein
MMKKMGTCILILSLLPVVEEPASGNEFSIVVVRVFWRCIFIFGEDKEN